MNMEAKPAEQVSRLQRTLMKFVKFMAASGLSTLLDLGLFYALERWAVPLIWPEVMGLPPLIDNVGVFCATAAARVCSATVNFLLNRNFVFRLKGCRGAAPKYILLCVVMMLVDGMAVGKLSNLLPAGTSPLLVTAVKAAVDTLLFVVNFFIQKAWVFQQNKQTEE